MAITYVVGGDLLASNAHTLVNTVNCHGVMGAGLARQFKARYPLCFPRYRQLCDAGQFKPGTFSICREYLPAHLILNAATKDRWQDDSRIEWVESILQRIVANFESLGMRSLAISKLGCGNGHLEWSVVGPLMVTYLSRISGGVIIYMDAGDQQY